MGKLKVFAIAFAFLGSNAFAIEHSQPALKASSTFNVFLKAEGILKGKSYIGFCNGSLIAEDLVVTAAHCLAGSTNMLNTAKISIGNYIAKTYANGRTSNFYYSDLDIVGVRNVYFPKSIDQKVRAGLLTSVAAITATEDIALIELERPVDQSKVQAQFINITTPAEYNVISANAANYKFIVVSTNLLTDISMQQKRYVPMNNISIDGLLNKAYHVPIWSTDSYHQVEEGDSGAPLLVNISGQWKLFGVTKGSKRDSLSAYLEQWTGKDINITPELNIFTPVAQQMCGLLRQANRPCN